MKHLTVLYHQLAQEYDLHRDEIFNYTIPEAWNLYGFSQIIRTHQKELIVHPYAFILYTLQHIMQEPEAKPAEKNWYRKSVLYYLNTRLTASWDHDRSSHLEQENLYHLKEQGTFLKAMLLLPLYRRMGINTILLDAPFPHGNSNVHDYGHPHAIRDFHHLDPLLKDPMLPNMTVEEQYLAFEECAHHLGFHILWQVDFSTLARDNVYIGEHPEWFYWIPLAQLPLIHAPRIPVLSENCLAEDSILELLEQSEDVTSMKHYFQSPSKTGRTLNEMEKEEQLTTVPFLHDRINSTLPADMEYTPLRFYTDTLYTHPAILRCDRFPGRKKNTSLWEMLEDAFIQLLSKYQMDGFYFTRIYLLPQPLLKRLVQKAKRKKLVVLIEDGEENIQKWTSWNVDGISGNSAYTEYDVHNHQLHNFVYRLKDQPLPVFAAAEYPDTPRITQYGSKVLPILLHVLNQFLPNSNPLYMNGMECMELQPLQLSYFQNPVYRNALPAEDSRCQKQPLLDDTWFEYRSEGMYTLPTLLEQITKLRRSYENAIADKDACIPLWFDSPLDHGIGFAYKKDTSILMVIANTDIDTAQHLRIHTDKVMAQLTSPGSLRQIFSTRDPFTYDLFIDAFHIIALDFEPGEIKFLELI